MSAPSKTRRRVDPTAGGKGVPRVAAAPSPLHEPAEIRPGGLATGAEVLARAVETLPDNPGVYRRGQHLGWGCRRQRRRGGGDGGLTRPPAAEVVHSGEKGGEATLAGLGILSREGFPTVD